MPVVSEAELARMRAEDLAKIEAQMRKTPKSGFDLVVIAALVWVAYGVLKGSR